MTVPVSDVRPASPPEPPRRRRRWVWLVVGVVVALVAGFVLAVGLAFQSEGGSVPSFPSLAAHPDSSLHGTVAYYANDTGCVRLVAASGQPSKTLWCLPKEGPSTWSVVGKPVGPQLVWLSDGRLEVTVFRMHPGPGGKSQVLGAGWQKIIDVHTGKVENVPTALVPTTPNTTTEPTVGPGGQRVSYTFDGSTGRAKVTLTDNTGTRTLLAVHGPGMYGYRFGPVFWAPNWQWIAASDDGRILVITPGTPSVTRVLVTNSGGGAGGGTAGPAFAVTSENLLTPVK